MRVVIATDKFKGSLSSVQAAEAMALGVREVFPQAEIESFPMADGGEGTIDTMCASLGVGFRESTVSGPLPGMRVRAKWLFVEKPIFSKFESVTGFAGRVDLYPVPTAVIEMAQASGLFLLKSSQRNVMNSDTYGTGELILDALGAGAEQIIVGLGGSATVDGGCGMARALGYRFYDKEGNEIRPAGEHLQAVKFIDSSKRGPRLSSAKFLAACDVTNPLLGEEGAARVYGPQKGASPEQVEILEKGLSNLAAVILKDIGVDVRDVPGSGAAGGLGAGLIAFCGAKIAGGFDVMASISRLADSVEKADIVLTGEGSFDYQTLYGKTPAGVIGIASKFDVPVIVITGRISESDEMKLGEKVAVYSVSPGPMEEEAAMIRAHELVRSGTSRLMRLLRIGCLLDKGDLPRL